MATDEGRYYRGRYGEGILVQASGYSVVLYSDTVYNIGDTFTLDTSDYVLPDTDPPAAPVITGISTDSGTGGDGITNDPTLTLSGTAEAGATVELFKTVGGVTTSLGTTTANGSGSWTFDYTGVSLAEGSYSFTAKATDGSNNTSPESLAYAVVIDTTPPTVPVITGISSDSGTGGDGITNDSTLAVSGTAEANATVELFKTVGGITTSLGTTTANGSGSWTFDYTGVSLAEGSYSFTAKATDAANNTSGTSAAYAVVVDTTAPVGLALSTTSLSTTAAISGANAATLSATDGLGITYGFAIGDGSSDADNARFTIDGNTLKVGGTALAAGSYKVYLKATDTAGNIAYKAFTLTVNAPTLPIDPGPSTPPSTQPPTSTTEAVCGVTVATKTEADAFGKLVEIVSVPEIPAFCQNTGAPIQSISVNLARSGDRAALLRADLPAGFGLRVEGPAGGPLSPSQALAYLTGILGAVSGDGSMVRFATGLFGDLSADTQIVLRSIAPIVPAGSTQAPERPIVISAPSGVAGMQEALVFDLRNLPPVAIRLDNVEFAAVVGNATLIGGEGQQVVHGDANRQFMALGAGDDLLHGGGGNDTLFGEGGNDVVWGGEGDDWVLGGEGNDLIGGGTGNDRGFGGTGNDILFGEEGDDTLAGGEGNDTVVGGTGNDLLFGEDGNDFLVGDDGNDTINAGAGNDVAMGGAGNDLIGLGEGGDLATGDAGNDTLLGEAGNDTLFGGAGDDLLNGGAGNDVLFADGGADTLWGGAGSDLFAFGRNSGGSVVMDFQVGVDRLAFYDTTIDLGAVIRSARVEGGNTTLDIGSGNRITIVGQTGNVAGWFG